MTYLIIAFLILLSGIFSGLNLGLMGLNAQELKRKSRLGNKDAKKIYPLRKTGNYLLVTLLLGNVAVNAIIALMLGSISSGVVAGLMSTVLIVIFGEIIPQATFSRYALQFGAKFVWLVKLFMIGFYPVAKPTAWLLDKLLGAELGTVYSKKELIEIIEEHKKSRRSDVQAEEEKIVRGALTIAEKSVREAMTPKSAMICFEESRKIDDKLKRLILDSGLSRFPVYKEKLDDIMGILHLRDVFKKANFAKSIGKVATGEVLMFRENLNLMQAFNKLIKKRHPMAIVQNEFGTVLGLITLEDILEEIIQDEIVDEDDKYVDMRKTKQK